MCAGWGHSRKPPKLDVRKPIPLKVCTSIIDGLKDIYFKKVRVWDGCRLGGGGEVWRVLGA